MDSSSNTVVVTGFGPFRQYLVNSSWEAVKVLSKRGLGKNINLHIMQLPVVYQKAKDKVFMIWTTLQPQLTVHVGLASSAKAIIILEQCGKNKGYQEMDACGFHPEGGCCMLDGPEKIESTINMKTLWKNISVEGIDIIFSRDAGSACPKGKRCSSSAEHSTKTPVFQQDRARLFRDLHIKTPMPACPENSNH
ncbi:pyroglutamyl-peptidase 1-like protein isoform X2 [Phaenicophaeus curvirostris]|uniref:pyroglutamyl-peptidase 1-like protein isoform X2 n=1 Tax=Phaenicophaeus curvirostris TaxID=33595 RepID=UPI0037F0C00E